MPTRALPRLQLGQIWGNSQAREHHSTNTGKLQSSKKALSGFQPGGERETSETKGAVTDLLWFRD